MTAAPRERSILFSASMIRALLDGRKTMTRRVVKPQPDAKFFDPPRCQYSATGHGGPGLYVGCGDYPDEGSQLWRCPFGAPGDLLWVRETWRTGVGLDGFSPQRITEMAREAGYDDGWGPVQYVADGAARGWRDIPNFGGAWGNIRQSIHMPRWASRLTLRVTAVRVERVQEISEEDARAEGVEPSIAGQDERGNRRTHRTGFVRLWDSINGRRDGCSWAENPFVWCVSFERIS